MNKHFALAQAVAYKQNGTPVYAAQCAPCGWIGSHYEGASNRRFAELEASEHEALNDAA